MATKRKRKAPTATRAQAARAQAANLSPAAVAKRRRIEKRAKFLRDNPGTRTAPESDLSPAKAKKILRDGEVFDKPLTPAQIRLFRALAGGQRKRKAN